MTDPSQGGPPDAPEGVSGEISGGTDPHDPKVKASLKRYWRANLRLMAGLLIVWAVVGLGFGVLLADWLNQFTLPGTGFPLGFWFAQQGSIIVFVLLILVYAVTMNRLDKKHRDELTSLRNGSSDPSGERGPG